MAEWRLGAWRMAFLVLMGLALSACASIASQVGMRDTDEAYEDFDAHLDGCTATYGFDPRTPQGLGEYQLGPNEREWRACAYEGVKTILIPQASSPDLYWRWIGQDQLMTDLIERQQMTRTERDQRLNAIQRQIAAAEKETESGSKQRELELTRGTIGILQGIQGM